MRIITWFTDSPDAGDPTCLCSWCGERIGEDEAPIVRLFDSDAGTEARFHRHCTDAALGLPQLPVTSDEDGYE